MLIFDQLNKEDRPLRLFAVALFGGLLLLVGGLWYVQIANSKRFQDELQDQALRTVRLPAVRGKILDASGRAIAENRPSYAADLYLADLSKSFEAQYKKIRPPKIRLDRAQIDELADAARFHVVSNIVLQVSSSLGDPRFLTNAAALRRHYLAQRALPFPILENLQPQQVAIFAERPPRVPGVELEIQPTRSYPGGSACAHILGILRRDDSSVEDEDAFFHYRLPDYKGHTGIEGMFDSELRGVAGVKSMMVNRLGYRQSETLQKAPEPGENVALTIDLDIQRAAERALYSSPYGTNTRGAAVVMNVNNGDIIAMASVPGYNPEIWPHGISHQESSYLNDPKLRPEINRSTQENYQPGSIFKIVVGLAALEQGVLDPAEFFDSPGFYKFPNRKPVHDTAPAGMYDFRLAFIHSSNTYFIKQGLKPGVLQRIIELGSRLHLGEKTGILPVQETKGNFPGPRELVNGWSDVDTGNLSIGQGPVDVTPLQYAVVVSAVANGGTVYWPRLVQRIEPAVPTSEEAPTVFREARVRDHLNVSEKSLRIVREAMRADVSSREGTGHDAEVPGLTVCGKTGTAEVEQNGRKVDKNAWFASYAPADRPRFAVVVVIESGASGGHTCAPIAGQIYKALKARYLSGDPKSLAQVK